MCASSCLKLTMNVKGVLLWCFDIIRCLVLIDWMWNVECADINVESVPVLTAWVSCDML